MTQKVLYAVDRSSITRIEKDPERVIQERPVERETPKLYHFAKGAGHPGRFPKSDVDRLYLSPYGPYTSFFTTREKAQEAVLEHLNSRIAFLLRETDRYITFRDIFKDQYFPDPPEDIPFM